MNFPIYIKRASGRSMVKLLSKFTEIDIFKMDGYSAVIVRSNEFHATANYDLFASGKLQAGTQQEFNELLKEVQADQLAMVREGVLI